MPQSCNKQPKHAEMQLDGCLACWRLRCHPKTMLWGQRQDLNTVRSCLRQRIEQLSTSAFRLSSRQELPCGRDGEQVVPCPGDLVASADTCSCLWPIGKASGALSLPSLMPGNEDTRVSFGMCINNCMSTSCSCSPLFFL